ncbi:hypothetical protein [Candidatus Frankia nodulisporulans]|uniref:hypothetical protein n=2 Tax=Candidatus Frankia nodulisporulans TaxID=2060052 RepID=UPI001CDCB777|nr:hypothetical protein [Candidatus Frankia nodulisporulans]
MDAAFAALGEHLARRDGWPAPQWVRDPALEAMPWWFVTALKGLHPRALVESPCRFANAASSSPAAPSHGRDMTTPGLDRESIAGLLQELNDELGRRGAKADLFLVSGAALALAYHAHRSTRYLDAVFPPTHVIRAATATLAERHGLSTDWLNDAVKGFLPSPDPAASRYFEADHLTVDIASTTQATVRTTPDDSVRPDLRTLPHHPRTSPAGLHPY